MTGQAARIAAADAARQVRPVASHDKPRDRTGEADAADGWGNLFAAVPRAAADEEFRVLLTRPDLRIERIVSTGQVSADWYDQDRDEWVLLVAGGAHLLIEGRGDEGGEIVLGPGDHLLIPAHVRHRVTWTDPDRPTIWLAVHFAAPAG